jgi:hypothetical protein
MPRKAYEQEAAPPALRHRRDTAVRATRWIVAGFAAGAVGLSGAVSAVAAHAFKGHARRPATTSPAARSTHTPTMRKAPRVHVPGPQSIPAIAGARAPLQPPAQAPSAAPTPVPTQAPAAPAPAAPAPQVSGGS